MTISSSNGNGHYGDTTRRKAPPRNVKNANGSKTHRHRHKKRSNKEASYTELFQQNNALRWVTLWIIGVACIEFYFFYNSVGILDRQLLRGREQADAEDEVEVDSKEEYLEALVGVGSNNLHNIEDNGSARFERRIETKSKLKDMAKEEEKKPVFILPRPRVPPPPKNSLLPRKLITIVGPESSGVKFLAHTLGVAVGAYKQDEDFSNIQATSKDGEWLIQPLSLPHGYYCNKQNRVNNVVDALVPDECFRYMNDPTLDQRAVEEIWYSTDPKKKAQIVMEGGDSASGNADRDDDGDDKYSSTLNKTDAMRARCRDEVMSPNNQKQSCGAQCGRGEYEGYALYPNRFMLNITSHIEFYLSRGVDVQVVFAIRDRTVSYESNLHSHCQSPAAAHVEDAAALRNMADALEKYGMYGSQRGALAEDDIAKERIVEASYEGLMAMQESYLYYLYHQLGIKSKYVPFFNDANQRYVTDSASHYVRRKGLPKKQPPRPQKYLPPPPKQKLLPEKVIAIFGPESSGTKFLATTLGVATGSFPEDGQWVKVSGKWVYHQYNYRRAISPDGEWEVQHISLPWGGTCAEAKGISIVEALVPAECFRYLSHPSLIAEEAERARDKENRPHTKRRAYLQNGNHDTKQHHSDIAEWWSHEHHRHDGQVTPNEDPVWGIHPQHKHHQNNVKESPNAPHNPLLSRPDHHRPRFLEANADLEDMDDEIKKKLYEWRMRKNKNQYTETDDVENGHHNEMVEDPHVDAAAESAAMAERCRNEVNIEAGSESWSCGSICGTGVNNGFALYPNRFFVNITSHLEFYASRGVEITALLSMRDRTVSEKSKLRDHCSAVQKTEKEDELAVSLMKEALLKYGRRKAEGGPSVIPLSYEGMMPFKGAYLLNLYKQLGIKSSYMPRFDDGNRKYFRDSDGTSVVHAGGWDAAELEGEEENSSHHLRFKTIRKSTTKKKPVKKKKKKKWYEKASFLPKKVITVFGPESSGTTFLTSALGKAIGNVTAEKESISRQSMSDNGEWEIQHLSLPWGWQCEKDEDMNIVEALVPEECFRYERDPRMESQAAGNVFYKIAKNKGRRKVNTARYVQDPEEMEKILKRCRHEAKISEENDSWSCGAGCGGGQYNGFALYPQRFSVNITSHIEWYISRGVDIKVIVSMRDRTISSRSKLNGHCHIEDVGIKEDEVALDIMKEAIKKYGTGGSRLGSLPGDTSGKERVIAVSYEGMIQMGEAYLFDLYHQLGINSTFVPSFEDGNRKYITDAAATSIDKHDSRQEEETDKDDKEEENTDGEEQDDHKHIESEQEEQKEVRKEQQEKKVELISRPPKPQQYLPPQPKKSLLPKKIIAVFGPESSGTNFLATSLGIATGSFPKDGHWSHVLIPSSTSSPKEEWIYHQHNYKRAMSPDGEWEVQHISLPWGQACQGAGEMKTLDIKLVEALVPAECFRYESYPGHSPESVEYFWHIKNENKTNSKIASEKGKRGLMSASLESASERVAIAERCQKEVHIAAESKSWTCGSTCGEGEYNGFALYPNRFIVNITSHINFYLSRGVEVTALLSLRDRSISERIKFGEYCLTPEKGKAEDELALLLMEEAMKNHGELKSKGKPHVVPVSYEGMMEFKEVYLMKLYKQLGINSTYVPTFEDGNKKYVKDMAEMSFKKAPKWSGWDTRAFKQKAKPTKPKESLLAKKVITVFGPESSGTTFLTTAVAQAIGIATPRKGLSRQAMSDDGEWEIQHLSLPWGWECEKDKNIDVIEALVPEECFRYERDPSIPEKRAADIFFKLAKKNHQHEGQSPQTESIWDPSKYAQDPEEMEKILKRCRHEAKISKENDKWTCGAGCGGGEYNGFALYPLRFSVNITSHIEWYLSRGVDIKVVVSMRDRTISSKSKLHGHCHIEDVGIKEDEVALDIMKEAIKNYGKGGSRLGSLPGDTSGNERVIAVSYEGLVEMEEAYLFQLYHDLGISSSFVPSFEDGNKKYIADVDAATLAKQKRQVGFDSRPPKPKKHSPPPAKTSLLPKKLISVVDSQSLSTTLGVAVGAFPSEGRWTESHSSPDHATASNELVYEGSVRRSVTSFDGEWEIQHLSLPLGCECDENLKVVKYVPPLVEALVPEECFQEANSPSTMTHDQSILEKCRNEVHINEDDKSFTCGSRCGAGQNNGYAMYPKQFMVNITSHISWWLSRGVDITVVLPMRDHSIHVRENIEEVCPDDVTADNKRLGLAVCDISYKMAKELKKEALQKYGKHGSLLKSGDKERVIPVSYEGLIELKEAYLGELYHQLGINSTYSPAFVDENSQYMKSLLDSSPWKRRYIGHKKGHQKMVGRGYKRSWQVS